MNLFKHLHNTAFFERQENLSTLTYLTKALTIKNSKFIDLMGSARQELAQYRLQLTSNDHPEQLEHLMARLYPMLKLTQLLENRPPIKVLIISNFDHAISLPC